MGSSNQWTLGGNKFIRLYGGKISFQRSTETDRHHRNRGIVIDSHSMLQMDDVSIDPNYYKWLNEKVLLKNDGKGVRLTKYCISSDDKRCNGGFFYFTPEEWQYFWKDIREEIVSRLVL